MVRALDLQLTFMNSNPCDMRFFKIAVADILDCCNFKFLTVATIKGVEIRHRAKFQGTAADIWQFFKMAAAAFSDFTNFTFLAVRTIKSVELRHCAKFCQNRSNSALQRSRYRDFLIFQNGGRRYLGLCKF